ncbi:MAG TPA: enoyl-CoA hydratase-related protein [Polyangia bacterium]|nr:enoyl-CoA hydratase-related protein [Polyangia bacterium]
MSDAVEAVRFEDEAGPDGRAGAIRLVTIDRPRALNAIDVSTMAALLRVFEDCAAAPGLRVVIVTGAGERAFVAGADVAALSTMSPEQAGAFSDLGHQVGHAMEALPVPVIGAVNGFALGGGCELALACDFVYAATNARFGFPEARLGAIPGFGGTVRLVQRVGLARARELLYTADTVDAPEALRLGLVNRVVDPASLLTEARRTAAVICGRAPLAVASAKQALRDNAAVLANGALRREVDRFAALFTTDDLRLGMRAFLDKAAGTPAWQGR